MFPRLDRRAFLTLTGFTLAACGAPAARAPDGSAPSTQPDLEEATLAELARRMGRGELTATAVTAAYLARIEALDRHGPTVHGVIEVNPDAMRIAGERDAERHAGKVRGPLHGIPILLKDNVDTADRMQTTAGSLALAGAPAPRDAHLVTLLRDAGAVLLGKTNCSEWANARSTHSTSGWSARGGLTRNPYALDRNASGSSSGSAVAVSANLCAAAVGTETDGSIVSPSSICGIVGVKPTVGLVSRAGIIPISHTQDTAGPMARTVADAALLLQALAGEDPRDPVTKGHAPGDYLTGLKPDALRGRRLGVVRTFGDLSKPVLALFDASLEDLRRLGATLVDPVALGPLEKAGEAEGLVLSYELKADMARYLEERAHPSGIRTLDDLLRFNKAHASEELGWFGQEFFEKSAARGGLDTPEYLEAVALCRKALRDDGIDAALAKHHLDALVAPTSGPAWLTDPVLGDNDTGGTSSLAAIAGYPSVTVPAGALRGLPLGLSFIGAAFSEATLLAMAFAFEQGTHRRRKPAFLATVDLRAGG